MRAIGFGSGGRRAWFGVWLPALAVAAMLGCEREENAERGQPGAFGPPGEEVSAADIMDDPESFLGKEVTVEGEVQRTAGAQAYVIGGGLGEREFAQKPVLMARRTAQMPAPPARAQPPPADPGAGMPRGDALPPRG